MPRSCRRRRRARSTAEPAVTPALAKLFELVTVVDEVDPLTFCTAVRVVKVST